MNWKSVRKQLIGDYQADLIPPDIEMPSLPETVVKVCQACRRNDLTVHELAEIIEADSSIAGDLLKYINSSASGILHQVNSVSRAVSLLGISKTKLHVVTSATRDMALSCRSPMIVKERFAISGLERAFFSREIADIWNVDRDVAFAGALLQDFMLPTLTSQFTDRYLKFMDLLPAEELTLDKFEMQEFGWNHTEAAARIMLCWGFPDDLICCVLLHHRVNQVVSHPKFRKTVVAAVALSSLLSDLLNQCPDGSRRLCELETTESSIPNLKYVAEIAGNHLRENIADLRGHKTLIELLNNHQDSEPLSVPA